MQTNEAIAHEIGSGVFSDPWVLTLEQAPRIRCEHLDAVLSTAGGDRCLTVFGSKALPSLAQNGRACAVFDGELYTRAALIRQLDLAPDVSNAEIILCGYQKWQQGILKHVRGVFALAVWDGETLLCARDPLGAFPLFYANWGESLLVSTSIKTFHESAGLPYKPNRLALADHLLSRWNFKEETFYDDVFRVPPGHALTVRRGMRRVERYWHPAPDPEHIEWISERDLGGFDAVFDTTINRFLDMAPNAIYLSGGLDSVSVAAVMVQNSTARNLESPLALSMLFPGEANEEDRQRTVARQLGLPLTAMPFNEAAGPQGLLQAAMDFSSRLSMPLLNTWLPAYYRLASEGRRQGARIILTGGGGDEWLTVSPYVVADMMRSLDISGILTYLRAIRRSYPVRLRTALAYVLWKSGLKPILRQMKYKLNERRSRSYPQRTPVLPEWIASDSVLREQLQQRAMVSFAPKRIKSFYLDQLEPLFEHAMMVSWEQEEIFEYGSMLDIRIFQPYWDADMVDFLYRTPPKLLMKRTRTKGLIRESIARRFPELGFERQKKVTSLNFYANIMLSQWSIAWEKLGGLQALADHRIIDERNVRAMLQSIVDQRNMANAHRLWHYLNLESWLRAHSA